MTPQDDDLARLMRELDQACDRLGAAAQRLERRRRAVFFIFLTLLILILALQALSSCWGS